MSGSLERIEERWRRIAPEAGFEPRAAERALAEIVRAYGEPQRHYHGLEHVASLLALAAQYAPALTDRTAVELAILYHDAVYDPSRSDNEQRSADLARVRLTALGLDAGRVARVADLILATRHGGDQPSEPDSDRDHLVDFDLSILAAQPDAYDRYAAAVRREYAIYPDLLYRRGRARVLAGFLAQPTLFRVPALAAVWEGPARANIARELAGL